MKNVSGTIREENQNTHFMFSQSLSQIGPFMWENVTEPDRPQKTRRMHIACWITKATNTLPEYATLVAFPLQHWLHEAPKCLVIDSMS
jgi:hypothetical protein